ncbi:alpha/beta fold hydrolase [Maribellus comscasis]|uniref:Alpha/beta fold hydrolase n=1 Tax=Maribellus comscasis TaxID=2681766 RepID=A0A6I6K2V5_9BACT|nr:alpha/beta hydrolase [Maribellus comscasis]QGY46847.1 alpha/beta fold hydrolase [Maribellus comscasis]
MIQSKNINGLNIRFKKTGEGATVLLLHGWGCDLKIFERVQNELEKKFQVYSIDFPGFGESDPPKEIWGVEEYTQFIESFIKTENIKNPILIGHSFGGRVSILFSSRNKTEKVILVGSAGVKPKRKLKYYFKVYTYKTIKKIVLLLFSSQKANAILENYRKKNGSSDYQNANGIIRDILVKVVNEDLKHVMPKMKSPTLLIWGENDTETSVSDAKIMEKLIPDAGLVVLKNSGHYSFLEKLNEFLIIVNNFLTAKKEH